MQGSWPASMHILVPAVLLRPLFPASCLPQSPVNMLLEDKDDKYLRAGWHCKQWHAQHNCQHSLAQAAKRLRLTAPT